ncbi:MAG: DNA-directed RNA polymerase subunit N [Candidatus Hodarchaeota archaeon]
MLIPVRCFTCGKLVGHLYEPFQQRIENGENEKAVLDEMGLNRYCCRRMLITHVDLIEEVIQFTSTSSGV